MHTHSISKVLYLLVMWGDFQGPQDPLRLPNQTCSYHSLAGLYTKLNRQIHKKSGFSGRILGVVLSGGFGLKIGYPIGQIWVNAHDHTSTVQDVCSHCIILRPGVRAMYHRGMLTVRCSQWGMVVGGWPWCRNLTVVQEKETMGDWVNWPYHTPNHSNWAIVAIDQDIQGYSLVTTGHWCNQPMKTLGWPCIPGCRVSSGHARTQSTPTQRRGVGQHVTKSL